LRERRRGRGRERVIERERGRGGERVLQRKRERLFHITTAVRECISDRHKSGDFNVGGRVSQREERSAGREYRME
jgi:hypothetical protein